MKKILNGPTVYRAKCPYCDCEFEYNFSDTDLNINYYGEIPWRRVVCPSCNQSLKHKDSLPTHTELKKEDTMST